MQQMLQWLDGRGKPLRVKVTTMDADLNAISVDRDATGQQLFDTVCKIIGLREIWYFGLCFTNRKGFTCWLQLDMQICKQAVPKQPDGSLHFLFLVKFFPESVKAELIQDMTRHLFFLQIRQSILSMDLYCPSEAAILLASYACQAIYGDQHGNIELDMTKLIPSSVIQQYDMSAEMWDEKIRNWWANNSGLCHEDAEEEFLCVAEELDMYGIQYYPIKNQKETELLLGVSAQGLGIYEPDNKLSPRPFFPWTEIKCISFKNKMFTICTADKSKIRFRAQDMSINQSLLDLCVGTHNLYLRRRQPDLLEVQQMRLQAQEQRQRRLMEQAKLQREREQRVQAELERDKLRAELGHLAERVNAMQDMMKNAEETQQLMAQRARLSDLEAQEMTKRANDAEAEVQRVRLIQRRAEESKMLLEKKMQDAESLAQRLIIQQRQQQQNGTLAQPPPYHEQQIQPFPVGRPLSKREADNCGPTPSASADSDEQNQQQRHHHQRLQSPIWANANGTNNSVAGTPITKNILAKLMETRSQRMDGFNNGEVGRGGEFEADVLTGAESKQSIDAELQYIYAELEQSRAEYNEKNQSLRERLLNFRTEMEALKREGTETENDRIFALKLKTGCFDKHSTLRKSGVGTSKAKAKYFDELSSKQPTSITPMPTSDS